MKFVKAAFIWVTCLVLGLVCAFVLLAINVTSLEDGTATFTNDELVIETLVSVPLGLLGLACFILVVLRPAPEPQPWKLGAPALVLVLLGDVPLAFPAALVTVVMVASRLTLPWIVAVSAVFMGGAVVSSLFMPTLQPFEAWVLAVAAVILVILLLIGWWRGRKRERLERLEERARIAEHERQELEERARLGERTRIARDMHDALAHRLSIISVHAGALSYRNNLSEDEHRRTVETIRTAVTEASHDLREVLSVLREEGDATVTDPGKGIEGLVDEARRVGAGVNAQIDDLGWANLPTLTRATTYRVVQELLTNARKHAPGETLDLRVTRAPDAIAIESSNREGGRAAEGGSGVGLVGMRERVEVLGGTLTIERGARFRIHAKVPIDS